MRDIQRSRSLVRTDQLFHYPGGLVTARKRCSHWRLREFYAVNKVLNAAAMTYVAATLQSILTLGYYVLILVMGSHDSD